LLDDCKPLQSRPIPQNPSRIINEALKEFFNPLSRCRDS
jgi:hypothetical protein